MSSVLGHASVGVSIYLVRNRLNQSQVAWALPVLVLLSIAPDFDYLPLWLFNIRQETRVTHSLLFGLVTASLLWFASIPLRRRNPTALTFVALVAASSSHWLLDLLVGVHSVPVLWPFTHQEVTSPLAVLPSAGRLHWRNPYLWRNLAIECGVLWPMLAATVAWARGHGVRWINTVPGRVSFLIWLAFLAVSLSLTR